MTASYYRPPSTGRDGAMMPRERVELQHVQRSILPGFYRFFVGFDPVGRQWLSVHINEIVGGSVMEGLE